MEQIEEKQKTALQMAYDRIPKGDIRIFLDRMKEILCVKFDTSVYMYMRGEREPKLTEAIAIERLFSEYGISVNWNCNDYELPK